MGEARPQVLTSNGHTVTINRHPTDTSRPATLWTATCDCERWSYQWGEKRDVVTHAKQHLGLPTK